MEREEIVALEYLYMFLGSEANMLKVLQIWDWGFHLNRDCIRFDKRFTFIDTFRSYVFGFDNRVTPEIPHFYCDRTLIRKIFEEKGLEKGNTVILAPYAYSLACPPEQFWIFLSDCLKRTGIKVAVNLDPASIHEEEKNYIPNVQALFFELSESVPYLEYAGFFIGMRADYVILPHQQIAGKLFYIRFRKKLIMRDIGRIRNLEVYREWGYVKRLLNWNFIWKKIKIIGENRQSGLLSY